MKATSALGMLAISGGVSQIIVGGYCFLLDRKANPPMPPNLDREKFYDWLELHGSLKDLVLAERALDAYHSVFVILTIYLICAGVLSIGLAILIARKSVARARQPDLN